MTVDLNLSRLIKRWKSEGIELDPRQEAQRIREVFASLGFEVASDAVHLYQAIGGMQEMDNEYWRLWSLAEILDANREGTLSGVPFADSCLDCYRFVLRTVDEQQSEVWIEGFDFGPPVRIAKSLAEFFGNYVTDPDAVLNPPSRPEYSRPSIGSQTC